MKMFDTDKARMIGLPHGEKNYDSRLYLDVIRTDRQTDGQNCYINIARQCADAR